MADSEKVSSLPSERERFEEHFGYAPEEQLAEQLNPTAWTIRVIRWEAWQAASAGRQELLEALIDARSIVQEYGEEMGAGPLTGIGQALQQYDALIAKHGG